MKDFHVITLHRLNCAQVSLIVSAINISFSSTVTNGIIILSLQALFAKLQQFATVAGDVLLGKEKIQKNLLARLTETVVMWLSDEQEFWGVFEDESSAIQAIGLQQVFLVSFVYSNSSQWVNVAKCLKLIFLLALDYIGSLVRFQIVPKFIYDGTMGYVLVQ